MQKECKLECHQGRHLKPHHQHQMKQTHNRIFVDFVSYNPIVLCY
jgi:hypothetical protein